MSSHSYERLLRLAQQKAIDGKGGLAASITKMCLNEGADLSSEEMQLTFDILRRLLDKVEEDVRRYVSQYLAARDDVPHDMVMALAEDTPLVAFPLLLESALLNEDDLIKVIDTKGVEHARIIARREGISERVTDRLVGLGDRDIVVQLLRNISASLSHPSLSGLVSAAADDVDLQELLINRNDLPADLAQQMIGSVAEVLRTQMLRKFQRYGHLTEEALRNAQSSLIDEYALAEEESAALQEAPSDEDKTKNLVNLLEDGDFDQFKSQYCETFELSSKLVDVIFSTKSSETMAIACRAADISRDQFRSALFRILGSNEFLNRERTGKIQDILSYYDQLDQKTALKVVERWRQTNF